MKMVASTFETFKKVTKKFRIHHYDENKLISNAIFYLIRVSSINQLTL